MKKIKKIITERLENARLDFYKTTREPQLELKGQMEAYTDVLNLIPAPRTETDILNDFEKLGYQIHVNNDKELSIGFQTVNGWFGINVYKYAKTYEVYEIINATRYSVSLGMQEHKLLSELFTIWGWL